MAIRPHWYRVNASDCASRAGRARDPFVKAAYQDLARAWLTLAESAAQLARDKPIWPLRGTTIHRKAA
jgi:hypothetical protein